MTLSVRRTLLVCALAALWGAQPPARAQSAYTLTTLKPPSSTFPMPALQHYTLDPAGRVTSHGAYDAGYQLPMCIPLFGCFAGQRVANDYLVAWPVTTASSVAPVKLSPTSFGDGYLSRQAQSGAAGVGASPDGRIQMAIGSKGMVYNAAGVLVAMDGQIDNANGYPELAEARTPRRGITDTGKVVLNKFGRSHLWDVSPYLGRTTNSLISEPLPMPPEIDRSGQTSIEVHAIVSEQFWVGDVRSGQSTDGLYCHDGQGCWPAVWRQGRVMVIDQQPGRVVAANAAEQLLIQRENWAYAVRTGAVEQPIAPLPGHNQVEAVAINASGDVVGRSVLRDLSTFEVKASRAILWRQGATLDLTAHAKARGAALPTGAVLEDARDINDAGTLVAVMRNRWGTLSTVRLLARP